MTPTTLAVAFDQPMEADDRTLLSSMTGGAISSLPLLLIGYLLECWIANKNTNSRSSNTIAAGLRTKKNHSSGTQDYPQQWRPVLEVVLEQEQEEAEEIPSSSSSSSSNEKTGNAAVTKMVWRMKNGHHAYQESKQPPPPLPVSTLVVQLRSFLAWIVAVVVLQGRDCFVPKRRNDAVI